MVSGFQSVLFFIFLAIIGPSAVVYYFITLQQQNALFPLKNSSAS